MGKVLNLGNFWEKGEISWIRGVKTPGKKQQVLENGILALQTSLLYYYGGKR